MCNDGGEVNTEPESISTPPVSGNETLLRQIGPGGNPLYFDPDREPVVHAALFIPTSQDHDGLSLIRALFRSRPWAAYRTTKPDTRHRLAPLAEADLKHLAIEAGLPRLDFKPTPDDLDARHGEPWAHCVAVQINRVDYKDKSDTSKNEAIKNWAKAVAASLSLDHLEGPFDPPGANDPYRPN